MKKRVFKKLMTLLLVLLMLIINMNNNCSTTVQAASNTKNISAQYLNSTKKVLHLGSKDQNLFAFKINKSKKDKKSKYSWGINKEKGTPDAITINKKTGKVTAKKVGSAYIYCKIKKADGSTIKPEASVTVRNDITEVGIKNVVNQQIVSSGTELKVSYEVIGTEAGAKAAFSGFVRWDLQNDTAASTVTDDGIVKSTKAGSFQIRAVCFSSNSEYKAWLKKKSSDKKYITASSQWYTINVEEKVNEAVVKTQTQLDDALSNKDVTLITISTNEAIKFDISQGDYSTKSIFVNAPNADMDNKGTFKRIVVQAIKDSTWIEYADGNIIYLDDSVASIVIDKDSVVKEIIIDRSDSTMNIIADGNVEKITVLQPSLVNLSGKSKNIEVTVEDTAADSNLSSSIPLKLNLNADTTVDLKEGAEGTTLNKSDKAVEVSVKNDTKGEVQISTNNVAEYVVKAGESAVITDDGKTSSTVEQTPTVEPTNVPTNSQQGGSTYYPPIVTPENNAPVANDDGISTQEDTSVLIPVLDNDTDIDSDTLEISDFTQGENGSVVKEGKSLIYTPKPNYHGSDSFKYTISDGKGKTSSADVNITITAVNDSPVANDDYPSVYKNCSESSLFVLLNDTDVDGDDLSVIKWTAPSHGTVDIESDDMIYTPEKNYSGPDSFNYTISDGNGGEDSASVNIQVYPVEKSIDVTGTINQPVTIDVPQITSLTLKRCDERSYNGGTVDIVDNKIVYTPPQDYVSLDGDRDGFNCILDYNNTEIGLIIDVTVNPVDGNNAAVAIDDAISTPEDTSVLIPVLDNDTDIDSDILEIGVFTQGENGSVVKEGKSLIYTPKPDWNGTDYFYYTARDGKGAPSQAKVVVTVTAVNDSPVANDDYFEVYKNSRNNTLPVISNDTDIDGDEISLIRCEVSHGTMNIVNDYIQFTPEQDYSGLVTVNYKISDYNGGESTASVTIMVYPVQGSIFVTCTMNQSLTIDLQDYTSLILKGCDNTSSKGGTLQIDDNKIVYTPLQGYSGQYDDFNCFLDYNDKEIKVLFHVAVH